MKRGWILVIIATNLLALAALALIFPNLMVSTGSVVKAHAAIATDCFACHAPLRGASAELCVSCHAVNDIGLRTSLGQPIVKAKAKVAFHQQLQETNCMACHTDHTGPRLVHQSRKTFSHALLLPVTQQRCVNCHTPPSDAMHRQISDNCAQCHNSTTWKPAKFDHAELFVLDGDHNASCITCHTANEYSKYTCYGCHEHRPDKIRSKHLKEGIRNFEDCVACHRSVDGEPEEGGSRQEKSVIRRQIRRKNTSHPVLSSQQRPTMSKRILIIQGHPDASQPHLCHALASSYNVGAQSAGHTIKHVNVAELDFPLLRSQKDFETGTVPTSLKPVQTDLLWAEHLVIFFPLWAGDMPALLKGFFEQLMRPSFSGEHVSFFDKKVLSGRTARVVVTMGMPAVIYRWYFRAHSIKSLERNLLGIVGIAPVHETLIGLTGNMKPVDAINWLAKLKRLGEKAQ